MSATPSPASSPGSVRREPNRAASLRDRFTAVRDRTMALCAPLSAEDQVVQPMADASPTKWHLAHTTWFFEAFVLDGERFDPEFEFLFNSYYEAVGPRVPRARRGMLTRPSLDRIHAYRAAVDRQILRALDACARGDSTLDDSALARLELGLHHEQQHQELILTDLKYVLGTQPLTPPYRALARGEISAPAPLAWHSEPGGIVEIGADHSADHSGSSFGFAFDNERPRHRVLLTPYQLACRPISNAEVLAFITDGGYRDHRLWLSDGWQLVQSEHWRAPLYWTADGALYELAGVRAIDPGETACHLSLYEADAIARWLGARLPSEAEWEHVAARAPVAARAGNFADAGRFQPAPAPGAAPGELVQLFGDVWEWTQSSYAAYPGFRPLPGALGEYNGKFMSGQYVLRGGSCLSPADHLRATYRNFFPAHTRWQMTGVRLARDS